MTEITGVILIVNIVCTSQCLYLFLQELYAITFKMLERSERKATHCASKKRYEKIRKVRFQLKLTSPALT